MPSFTFAPKRLLVPIAGATLVALCLAAGPARAGCNLTAAAVLELRSTLQIGAQTITSLVNRPVASPGDAADVLADLGGCNAGKRGFDPVAANHVVTLTFISPAPGNPQTVIGPLAASALLPLECTPADCNRLRITLPDTRSVAATNGAGTPLTTPPNGLAGPAQIRIERTGVGLIAVVGALFQPSTGCAEPGAENPEQDFGYFTVLPRPNVLVEGQQPAPGILGGVDGYGHLVVPLDFGTGIKGDAQEGVLLAPAGTPNATIFEVTSLFAPVSSVLSFNPLGRLIPPLLALDGNTLIASSDVRFSLVQARADDPTLFPRLMEMDSLGRRTGSVAAPAEVAARTVAPLDSLRATLGLVAITADESYQGEDLTTDGDTADLSPVYIDLGGGGVEASGEAAATLRTSPAIPVITAEGDILAYAVSEAASVAPLPGFDGDLTGNGDAFEDVLRVRRATGAGFTDLTNGIVAPMAPEPIISKKSLVVSHDVFFVTDESTAAPRQTVRASEGGGATGDEDSANPSADGTGRQVAWDSFATTFPGGNEHRNVYLTDLDTAPGAAPLLLSESLAAGGGNGDSARPALGADGGQVAFESLATDLDALHTSGEVVWERSGQVDGMVLGLAGLAGFILEPGAAEVPGVDYAHCTDPSPGLEIFFREPPVNSGTGPFHGTLSAEDGCFQAELAGTYVVSPFPLKTGSTITLDGVVTSFASQPALLPALSNLRFRSSLAVIEPGGPGFAFEGGFEMLADVDGTEPAIGSQIYARALDPLGPIALVSANAAGEAGEGDSTAAASDASGRLVAFASDAANLVPGDSNSARDVFVVDRDADGDGIFDGAGPGERSIVRASETALGGQVDEPSDEPAFAAGGGFVAFASDAPDLVGGDGNGTTDVFVVPVQAAGGPIALGAPERVSVRADGGEAHGPSFSPSLSGDGAVVAFASDAPDLVDGDGNGSTDVFVVDRTTGEVERVSVSQGGGERVGDSFAPSLSEDGRFVAFTSWAALVPDDDNGLPDVYRVDRRRPAIERVSVGSQANGASGAAALAGDGRSVFFDSLASNLVNPDGNDARDVFGRVYGPGASLNPPDTDDDDLVLQVFRRDVPGLGTAVRTAVRTVDVHAGRAVVLTPEAEQGGANLNAGSPLATAPDQDSDDLVAQVAESASDTLLNVQVAAVQASIDEILCLAVPEAGEGAGGTDLDGDGDTDDDVLVVGRLLDGAGGVLAGVDLEVVPVPVGQVAALGRRCLIQRLETPGNDWNGDGDFADAVFFVYDDENPAADPLGRLTGSGAAAAGFISKSGSPLVGFPVCEADQGATDLNRDGDVLDCVEHIADLSVPPNPLLAVANSERQTTACTGVGCDRFTGVALNGTVSFLGTEPNQSYGAGCGPSIDPVNGCDQDGNLSGRDTVRYIAKIVDGVITEISVQYVSPNDPPGPALEGPSGTVWRQRKDECSVALIACPETRDRYPQEVVNGYLPVKSACELQYDLDRTDPGLDCVTLRPWFVGDRDGDGLNDNVDNCQSAANGDQADDVDGDLLGDACDGNDSPPPRTCDANGDGFIDQSDVSAIFAARGQVAQGGPGNPDDGIPPTDLRDPDEDGLITANDSGICAGRCDLPDCAPAPLAPAVVKSACGLLGVEPLLVVALLHARRRRARRA